MGMFKAIAIAFGSLDESNINLNNNAILPPPAVVQQKEIEMPSTRHMLINRVALASSVLVHCPEYYADIGFGKQKASFYEAHISSFNQKELSQFYMKTIENEMRWTKYLVKYDMILSGPGSCEPLTSIVNTIFMKNLGISIFWKDAK